MGTVVIVGGTGGIGEAVARRVAARGDRVHLVARGRGRLEALAAELGGTWSEADAADVAALTAAVRAGAEAAGGTLAGLAYAVGTLSLDPLPRLTEERMLHDFRVNALGAAASVQAALPALQGHPGGAAVLLFSSVAVAQGFASHASISLAKGAVEGLTRALAAELAPAVRVNCLAPSLTRTGLTAPIVGQEAMAKGIAQLHALRRLGEPEDLAPLADLLLSPASGWITGQVIGVDGGRATLRSRG